MVDRGKQVNRFMADGVSRPFRWVTVIHELEPDLFLFGTLSDSLYLYDIKKETVRNLSTELQPNPKFEKLGNITAITQDNEGNVWIATNKNGLYRLNRNLKLAKHYQKEDGLSDSYINSLTIDRHQNIWVTTGKISVQTESYDRYFQRNEDSRYSCNGVYTIFRQQHF